MNYITMGICVSTGKPFWYDRVNDDTNDAGNEGINLVVFLPSLVKHP
jgi:hypothetical protein